MQGLKVQCPGCKKVYHETTEKYDPDVRPNGAMVRLLDPWKGWGWAAFDAEGAAVSTTLCSEMLCPGCTAPLAPSGRLTVIKPFEVAVNELQVPIRGDNPQMHIEGDKVLIADPKNIVIESQPPAPKQKRKKKANALKKKAKKKGAVK
jgi:hypothetical protein